MVASTGCRTVWADPAQAEDDGHLFIGQVQSLAIRKSMVNRVGKHENLMRLLWRLNCSHGERSLSDEPLIPHFYSKISMQD
jgi:hypothetical protein